MKNSEKTLDMIVNLCKNRGFIYPGSEKDDGTVKSEDLAAKLPGSVVVDGLEGAAAWVRQNAKKGDLVVCMSCGDLYKAADMMVEQ